MQTRPITPEILAASVIAVPPLARNSRYGIDTTENTRIIRKLEAGGITTLLYGGNAALAHVALSEYSGLLKMLVETASPDTLVIPSVGPQYGMMMDQADILRDFAFPTVMLLPIKDATTPAGLAAGIRRFTDRIGKPIVVYLKQDGVLDIETIQKMHADGMISWIKYAIVRSHPAQDQFLRQLVDTVGASHIVSGMGEQPAITHLRDYGLIGFTAGCVCVAPALSTAMLKAIQRGDYSTAEKIRQIFEPLESLRDEINPVRVLHAAVRLAGIANTGPLTPFWSAVVPEQEQVIEKAARDLLNAAPETIESLYP